jgi:cytochrome c553
MRGIAAVLLVLAACSDTPDAPPAAPQRPRFEQVSSSPAAHGERLAKVLGCTGCHNDNLTGNDWSEPQYGTLWSANLTRSAEAWSDAELTQMIVAGKRPDRAMMEMPSALFAQLHPDDIAALVDYLKALDPVGPVHPEPTIGPALAEEIAAGTYRDSVQQVADHAGKGPPDLGPDHALGRQIAGATCAECHGSDLRGRSAPGPDAVARPDLRMVAAYSRADFATLMRAGKAVGNREVGLMSTVARRRYASLTDAEEQAVYAYLVELAAREPAR